MTGYRPAPAAGGDARRLTDLLRQTGGNARPRVLLLQLARERKVAGRELVERARNATEPVLVPSAS